MRYTLRIADPARAATVLNVLSRNDAHEFWPDDTPYRKAMLVGVYSHRQLTDAYLANAAFVRKTRLVTFDAGLKTLRPDVVELLRP